MSCHHESVLQIILHLYSLYSFHSKRYNVKEALMYKIIELNSPHFFCLSVVLFLFSETVY